MTFATYGNRENPSLLLIPGLGVSYEIFLPLIDLLKDRYHILAVGIDGFLIGGGLSGGKGCFRIRQLLERDIVNNRLLRVGQGVIREGKPYGAEAPAGEGSPL